MQPSSTTGGKGCSICSMSVLQHHLPVLGREGLAAVKKEEQGDYGYIDKEGNEVIPFNYPLAEDFKNGLAEVGDSKYSPVRYGLIDKAGNQVVPCVCDWIGTFGDGLAEAQYNGGTGYIDMNGNEVLSPKYMDTGRFSEGFAPVLSSGVLKYYYIDKAGNEVTPRLYDAASSFSDGLAVVVCGSSHGYINTDFVEVIPCIYEGADSFVDGVAPVKSDGKWGFIDKEGNEVVPCIYDSVLQNSEGLAVSEGFAVVEKNGNWGFVSVR